MLKGGGNDDNQERSKQYLYKAPFGVALRRVKVLSIASCGLAIAACPAIMLLPTTIGTTSGRLSICASLALFGMLTTGLLHWFSSPYVHQLKFDEDRDEIEVKTLTLFARQRWERINLDGIKAADTWRPLATFEAHGRFYYIHEDQFGHKGLLSKLSPPLSTPKPDS